MSDEDRDPLAASADALARALVDGERTPPTDDAAFAARITARRRPPSRAPFVVGAAALASAAALVALVVRAPVDVAPASGAELYASARAALDAERDVTDDEVALLAPRGRAVVDEEAGALALADDEEDAVATLDVVLGTDDLDDDVLAALDEALGARLAARGLGG